MRESTILTDTVTVTHMTYIGSRGSFCSSHCPAYVPYCLSRDTRRPWPIAYEDEGCRPYNFIMQCWHIQYVS